MTKNNTTTRRDAAEPKLAPAPNFALEKDGEFKLMLLSLGSLLPLVLALMAWLFVAIQWLKLSVLGLLAVIDSANLFYGITYAVAVMLGALMLYLLIRPLFLPPVVAEERFCLDAGLEASLYSRVRALVVQTGAGELDSISVSTEVVVDAHYRTFKDLKHGRLSVVIGLPLLITLREHEMTALLIHELVRYSRPRTRVLAFVIRRWLHWRFDMSNLDDPLAKRIDGWRESRAWLVTPLFPFQWLLRFTRALAAKIASSTESLALEVAHELAYRADQVQAAYFGRQRFEGLLRHLVQIDQAYHFALEKMLLGDSRPANMSELIHALYLKNPPPTNQFIEMSPAEYFNSWHLLPPPSSRTRRVAKVEGESSVEGDALAANWCVDIEAMGVYLTQVFYLRHDIAAVRDSAAAIVDERERPLPMARELEILKRYSSGLFRREVLWILPLDDKLAKLPEERIVPFLNKVVISVRHSLPEFTRCMDLLPEYQKNQSQYHFYQWLIKDGSKNRPDADVIDGLKFALQEFEEKYADRLDAYGKAYGVRVAAAVELGKELKAYKSAKSLMKMLSGLAQLQAQVRETKIKCRTLEKLVLRRAEGDTFHQKTISRLTKMLLQMIDTMEVILAKMPQSLLGEALPLPILETRLRLDQLNGEDYERLVADRFFELVRYYEGFNTAISAKLAQFVEAVESRKQIEAVVKVKWDGGRV